MSAKKSVARSLLLLLLCAALFAQTACRNTPGDDESLSSNPPTESQLAGTESQPQETESQPTGMESQPGDTESSTSSQQDAETSSETSSTGTETGGIDEKLVQYVTLFFTNKRHEEVEPYLREMEYLYGVNDSSSDRMYAFGLAGPMLLTQSTEEMAEVINAGFDYAEKYNIPVYFQLDDCTNYTTYFGSGAKIKYWEDPSMCEWVAFPEAGETYGGQKAYGRLPRFWYNWGSWRSVPAAPNFASASFRQLVTNNLKKGVLEPLMKRYNELKAKNKGYLFAGMAVGWETQIPDYSLRNTVHNINPYDLPICYDTNIQMQTWEMTQYGYGALHALGYDQEKLDKEAAQKGVSSEEWMRQILYSVIHNYIEMLSKTCYDAGVPRNKIFTHCSGMSSVLGWETTLCSPIWVAVNDYSTPGFTMVELAGPYDLPTIKTEIALADPDQRYFANSEGYATGLDTEEKAIEYFKTMFGNGALNVTAFAYADPPTPLYTFKRTPDFPYNIALRKWLNNEF